MNGFTRNVVDGKMTNMVNFGRGNVGIVTTTDILSGFAMVMLSDETHETTA